MAGHTDRDESSTLELNRRGWLRFLAVASSSAALVGASGSGAAAEYETITVSAGESKRLHVGDGETLENVLIDVSASGADVQIRASGDDWAIRNVGVRGAVDVDKHDGFWSVLLADGNGVVENVYLGDGSVDYCQKAGMGTPSSHGGHIDVRRCYVANWADNGIYASHTAENGGGTVTVSDSYFHDNNVAHLRLAADGSVAENCVVHNTNSVSPLASGSIHSKGVYTGYGDPDQEVYIRSCDIAVTEENTNGDGDAFNSNDEWHSEMSTIVVSETQYRGSVHGPYVDFGSGNGHDVDLTPPAGVPASASEAAEGGSSDDDGSGSDSGSDSGTTETTLLSISGDGSDARYRFSVDGDVEKTTDGGGTIDDADSIDAGTVSGSVAGGTDSYRFSGEIEFFQLDGTATVSLDGTEVDPSTLGTSLPNLVTFTSETGTSHYEFTVDGELRKSIENGGTIDDADEVSGSTAAGSVKRDVDSYRFSGEITDFSMSGRASVDVVRDDGDA